jgi:eukaryotic-like serine/threonine-protein kinase
VSLKPGTTIGPYTVVSKLGEGGMGEVYRATDARLGRDVALKVLPDEVSGDPDRRSRFDREAEALAALNHFNIAQVYGFEDRAIVMELLEGETLRDRLNVGPLPVRKALDYGIQIARGLAAAHERGRTDHRSPSPVAI